MFKSIYIFDAYGTLFDVNSAARIASAEPDFPELAAHWPAVAANWRRKQLEYTWLRAVSGRHADFEQVTKDGLDWTLEAAKLTSPALRERLLALYWELDAYPEVTAMLARLKAAGARTAILSNGTPEMLRASPNTLMRFCRSRALASISPTTPSTTWSARNSAAQNPTSCLSRPTVGMQRAPLATALQPHG